VHIIAPILVATLAGRKHPLHWHTGRVAIGEGMDEGSGTNASLACTANCGPTIAIIATGDIPAGSSRSVNRRLGCKPDALPPGLDDTIVLQAWLKDEAAATDRATASRTVDLAVSMTIL